MLVILTVSLLSILLTYFETIGKLRGGMLLGFIFLTAVASIQYRVGSDYITYYHNYLDVASCDYTIEEVLAGEAHRDIGWGLILWLFSRVQHGFFWIIALIAIFENAIYYNFIHKYVDKKWWTFSVFLYSICTSMYLMNFTMLRQALADAIFLACWPLIINKKWIPSLIILYLATFIHSSAKIILPFAFWGFMPLKKAKIWGIVYALVMISLYLFGELINDIVAPFFEMEDFKHFAVRYGNDSRKVSFGGLGFWIYMVPVILMVYYFITNKEDDKKTKSLVAISAVGSLIMPFGVVLPMIGRLANYFVAFRLAAYPTVYQSLQNNVYRKVFLSLLILITIYDYYIFFSDPIWVSFTTYRTIFEVI